MLTLSRDVLGHLFEQYCPGFTPLWRLSSQECYRMFDQNGAPPQDIRSCLASRLKFVVASGNVPLLEWIHCMRRRPWGALTRAFILPHAAYHGHLNVVVWCVETLGATNVHQALAGAVAGSAHPELVRYCLALIENEPLSPNIIEAAGYQRHVHLLELFREHIRSQWSLMCAEQMEDLLECTVHLSCGIIRGGHVDLFELCVLPAIEDISANERARRIIFDAIIAAGRVDMMQQVLQRMPFQELQVHETMDEYTRTAMASCSISGFETSHLPQRDMATNPLFDYLTDSDTFRHKFATCVGAYPDRLSHMLDLAIKAGDLYVVKKLFPRVNRQRTPWITEQVDKAAKHARKEVLSFLLEQELLPSESAFTSTAMRGDLDMLRMLAPWYDCVPFPGTRFIMEAAVKAGHLHIVQELLKWPQYYSVADIVNDAKRWGQQAIVDWLHQYTPFVL